MLCSLPVFSPSLCYPHSNWGLLVLLPRVDGCIWSRTLWVSPTNSAVRLAVSPAAASTPTGVFNQWFEALFPSAGALVCGVCLRVQQLLPQWPAAALPILLHNPPLHWVRQPLPCCESSLPQLPFPPPPTGLDECFFFISLVVGLPYSLIFCQFWLFFVFKLLFSSFGCARRHSVSTYTSILAGSPLFCCFV